MKTIRIHLGSFYSSKVPILFVIAFLLGILWGFITPFIYIYLDVDFWKMILIPAIYLFISLIFSFSSRDLETHLIVIFQFVPGTIGVIFGFILSTFIMGILAIGLAIYLGIYWIISHWHIIDIFLFFLLIFNNLKF